MSKLLKQRLAGLFISAYQLTGFKVKRFIQPSDLRDLKTIAIFSTTALGDFLLNTPAIVAIRNKYPDAKIIMVVHKRNALLVEGSSMFNEIVYWDGKANDVLQLGKALRSKKLDATFILHSRSPYDIVLATLAHSRIIIKDVYYNDYLGRKTFALNRFLSVNYDHRGVNIPIIHQKSGLLEHIGIDIPSLDMVIPVPFTPERKDRRTLGIHLGASSEERCWPIDNFAAVIGWVLAKYPDIDVELLGGPGEIERNNRLMSLVAESEGRVINSAGKTNLKQLVEKVAALECLLVGDTGPLHIAIAVKTRTVAMFPSMLYTDGTRPLQDQELHQVLTAQEALGMSSISVDDVEVALRMQFEVVDKVI
ncbi:glycosyltransferase family 9 protein [Pragia fontium]|uniref:glycosyltransferase family 9 protein n=1 Tax=Pragia fontium TaxID=82985 RepID=UPI0006496018|nr:glycosyltransferase family 9 protein [Pragia fontium]AKJ41920.1 ADP-heptose--lipooligosaccharide heptosyltransferase II [Pragia fontium]